MDAQARSYAGVTVPLLGRSIAHSLSPAFQQAAFDEAGLAVRYVLWDIEPAALPAAMDQLRAGNGPGANVTVPFKERILPFLDDIAPLAARVGAANTLVNDRGRWRGENTDVGGFLMPLHARAGGVRGARATLLGAGGAARAVAIALLDAGVGRLTVVNRTPARAAALATALADPRVTALALSAGDVPGVLERTDLLVDATSSGWAAATPVIEPAWLARLPARALVYDLTYRPTPLVRLAAARGLATLDGLPMLVEQGALAWELWTGLSAPRALMWRVAVAARDALTPRG